ncbi:MAG: hypothetical protein LBB84_04930 [Tannerellaceae bacterium]|nr:hypothetical protein [Tannerellaceae bacterium]
MDVLMNRGASASAAGTAGGVSNARTRVTNARTRVANARAAVPAAIGTGTPRSNHHFIADANHIGCYDAVGGDGSGAGAGVDCGGGGVFVGEINQSRFKACSGKYFFAYNRVQFRVFKGVCFLWFVVRTIHNFVLLYGL